MDLGVVLVLQYVGRIGRNILKGSFNLRILQQNKTKILTNGQQYRDERFYFGTKVTREPKKVHLESVHDLRVVEELVKVGHATVVVIVSAGRALLLRLLARALLSLPRPPSALLPLAEVLVRLPALLLTTVLLQLASLPTKSPSNHTSGT